MEPTVHVITAQQAGRRLDVFLVDQLKRPRKLIKAWIESGAVRVNYEVVKKAALKLQAKDELSWRDLPAVPTGTTASATPAAPTDGFANPPVLSAKALKIQLRDGRMVPVLHADEHLLVLDKPPGCSVHEGIGHKDDTLSAALERALGPRGKAFFFVSRLDRDTSGAIVIARTAEAQTDLMDQFKSRAVEKTYFALAGDAPDWDKRTIDLPLIVPREELGGFADPRGEPRKTLVARDGAHAAKEAATDVIVLERFNVPGPVKKIAFLELHPRTGRRHQIRVHLASQGMPLLVDELYGSRRFNWRVLGMATPAKWPLGHNPISRQPLHAGEVEFVHPFTRAKMTVASPLPKDMLRLLELLRRS